MTPEEVLAFWFEESKPEQWFGKDAAFDDAIRERFGTILEAALKGELASWRATADGRLAEIIVLDQFSRNIFRNSPEAFTGDTRALEAAQEAVAVGADREVALDRRSFFYMPYMHSESLEVHEAATPLFTALGDQGPLKYELLHKEIIERFGRYPSRNEVLGRTSTADELEFLKTHTGF